MPLSFFTYALLTDAEKGWSYRAKNSIYRALINARDSFPRLSDVIFVTEPEAAALYTVRYLTEDKREELLKVAAPSFVHLLHN